MLLPSVALLLLVAGRGVSAALFSSNSPVVTADAKTFEEEVLSLTKPTFVAFTAPWCGHCRNLSPEYERASRSLDGIIKFVNVDCDEQSNAGVCQRYGVTGFPTIKMFPPTTKRLPKDYRGERTAKALIEYGTSELPLSNVKKISAAQLASFVKNDNDKVLLFTSKPSSTPLYKSLALDLRGALTFATARSDHADVRDAANDALGIDLNGLAGAKLLFIPSKDASAFKVYDGPPKFKALFAWLQEVSPEAAKVAASTHSKTAKAKSKSKGKPKGHKTAHKDL